jgi:hypothetical protein
MIVCLLAAPSVDLAACVVLVECVFVYHHFPNSLYLSLSHIELL